MSISDRRREAFLLGLEDLCTEGLPVADEARFPAEAMDRLAAAGVLRAPLPEAFGGLGLGTETGQGLATFAMLHSLGRISLPLGRLVEAHVNALRIVARYGGSAVMARAADAALNGDLFGLWVTDPPGDGALTMTRADDRLRLSGGKMFCSGAGHVRAAVVTAFDPSCGDRRLILVRLDGTERISPLPAGLAGMKAAVTGQIDLTARMVPADCLIGEPADYMKEPDFSAGAWRSSAVALGGLYRLTQLMREQLTARGRAGDPHQRVRFGTVAMAHETGRLWLRRAAVMAEDLQAPADEIVATTGFARLVVERACLDALDCAHRSLGLSAFLTDNPVERLTRDLQTYLRQPAGDEVLDGAAAYFLTQGEVPSC
jgi:alkylation response protein AidB-like acyl-CoA dehydrogenase